MTDYEEAGFEAPNAAYWTTHSNSWFYHRWLLKLNTYTTMLDSPFVPNWLQNLKAHIIVHSKNK